ncbi:hypothetical protein BT96DRAFT_179954 [Gymnopus androsaceus JB14]|uniref:F-box domain-containing protein n=1 Tax=Gymnopus androsaceus JB14 TaxID=1447944 RepID=A0A6A4GBA5_9AGAR|nr:hypothetical protein BT96DRAFT_179954 [Gymnopus androsaceus JB14]
MTSVSSSVAVEMERCASVSDKTDSSLADQAAYVWNGYEELLAKSRSNDIPKSAIERSQLRARIEILRCSPFGVESAKILELAKSLLSPIRRLPPEIMSLIFQLETDETIVIGRIATSMSDKSDFSGSIFLLTWACAWWREIILSQPSFWTSMMISSQSANDNRDFETTNSLLRECLLRAGSTMPLRFYLFLTKIQLSAPGLSGVLDALAEVASRWKEFRFKGPSLSLNCCTSERIHHPVELLSSRQYIFKRHLFTALGFILSVRKLSVLPMTLWISSTWSRWRFPCTLSRLRSITRKVSTLAEFLRALLRKPTGKWRSTNQSLQAHLSYPAQESQLWTLSYYG